jgi:hypothetical protein
LPVGRECWRTPAGFVSHVRDGRRFPGSEKSSRAEPVDRSVKRQWSGMNNYAARLAQIADEDFAGFRFA